MRKFLFCLVLLLPTSAISSSGYSTTLLILGDSLSAGYGIDIEKGWVHLLQQKLSPEHRIINGAVSGDTTGAGLARLPSLLQVYQPEYVLIELGGNDGLQGHPLSNMKKNLQTMIKLCRDHQAQPILLGMQIPPNYGKRYTAQFAAIYTTVAEENNVPFIPFIFDRFYLEDGMIQEDGIHPTELAQPLISEILFQHLKSIINPVYGATGNNLLTVDEINE